MKHLALFLLLLVLFSSNLHADSSDAVPAWAADLYTVCSEKHSEKDCAAGFEKLLHSNNLWGEVKAHYDAGTEAWKNKPLQIEINEDKNQDGSFDVLLSEGQPAFPSLTLSMARSFPEMLITLNHELTHFANSKNLLKLVPERHRKAGACISAYEQSVLKDESKAFQSEITFWNASPAWFKKLFEGVSFHSKFADLKTSTYADYYRALAEAIKKDPNYASKQYVKLGQYPACATGSI